GQHRPAICYLDPADPDLASCLNFGYGKDSETGGDYSDVHGRKSWLGTAAPGEEYFLFLSLSTLDFKNDLLTPERGLDSAGGMYRIVDGRVMDSSNFWGAGTTPTVAAFRERLQT